MTKQFRKTNKSKSVRASKCQSARDAIGRLQKDTDLFILTYGQFSLIDAIVCVLDQTGPAHVVVGTWTAADAHLERTAALIESAEMLSFRMIVDRSFPTRQPKYCAHMELLFGMECIRTIRTHAKFVLIRNGQWDVVIRTSMNLNENPRLENIEISDNADFARFFQSVADDIFREVAPREKKSNMLDLVSVKEDSPYSPINAGVIKRSQTNEPKTTHTINRS